MADRMLVSRTAEFARQTLSRDSSGHDWWHVQRVWQLARQLGQAEHANLLIVELSALLHDIADWKFHDGDETAGPRAAARWLNDQDVEPSVVDQVCEIITQISFKGAGVETPMSTLEGAVVQDADRLDAIGAIGIARAFAYGGFKGRALFDPGCPPQRHDSFAAYKKHAGPTINHFYEKLLLLKDRLHTPAARKIAAQRHRFMEDFLAEFYAEWGTRPDWALPSTLDDRREESSPSPRPEGSRPR